MKTKIRFFFNVIEEQPFGKAFGYAYVVTRTSKDNNHLEIIDKSECYSLENIKSLTNSNIAEHPLLKQSTTLRGMERSYFLADHHNELTNSDERLLYKFYESYTRWLEKGAEIWGDNNFPSKTNFLMRAFNGTQRKSMKILMPRPFHDVADFVDININRRVYIGRMDLQETHLLDTVLASVFAFHKSQSPKKSEITTSNLNPAKFIDENHAGLGTEIFQSLDMSTLLGFRAVNKKWNELATSVLIKQYPIETSGMQFFNKINKLKANITNPDAMLTAQTASIASVLMQSLLQKTNKLVKQHYEAMTQANNSYGFNEVIKFGNLERKLLHEIELYCKKIADVTEAISAINNGNYGYYISPKLEKVHLEMHLQDLDFSKYPWDFESWIMKDITFDFKLHNEAIIILKDENCENVKLTNTRYNFSLSNVLLHDSVKADPSQGRKRKRSQGYYDNEETFEEDNSPSNCN